MTVGGGRRWRQIRKNKVGLQIETDRICRTKEGEKRERIEREGERKGETERQRLTHV